MVRMFVSPYPNSYFEILTPKVMALGDGAFGRWLVHEDRALMNGIRLQRDSSSHSIMWGHSRKQALIRHQHLWCFCHRSPNALRHIWNWLLCIMWGRNLYTFFFSYRYPIDPKHFIEKITLFPNALDGWSCPKLCYHICVGLLHRLVICSCTSTAQFWLSYFYNNSFWYLIVLSFPHFFFLKNAFAILALLYFHMNFRINSKFLVKKQLGFRSRVHWTYIFTVLHLPIHNNIYTFIYMALYFSIIFCNSQLETLHILIRFISRCLSLWMLLQMFYFLFVYCQYIQIWLTSESTQAVVAKYHKLDGL